MYFFKVHCLFCSFFDKINVFLWDAGMGDKEQVRIDVCISAELVFYIFYEDFIQRAAVFLSYSHTAVTVVYLDAGLELQHVCSQRGHGGTASSCMEKGQGVEDETGVTVPGVFPEFFCGKAAVLVYTGKGVPQIDMDDFLSILYPRAEVVNIFLYVDCSGFGKNFVIIIFLIDFFRRNVNIVSVFFFIQDDMQGESRTP